jgi:hypothetical protein
VLRSPRADAAPLRAWAERIALRRGQRIAVVALARRLAGVLYAMWRDGTGYQIRRRREEAAASDRRARDEVPNGRGEHDAAGGRW